jgi:hypothetical protein
MKPDGDWDEYEFTPQSDLTAYELAVILKRFRGAYGEAASLAAPLFIRKDEPGFDSSAMARHFTKRKS